MNTKVVRIKEEEKTRETLEKNPGLLEAAEILKNGGLVAFPTETVYGLGANALNEEAAKKIYAAKGRPSDNPLIAHISCMEELPAIVKEIPEAGRKLAEKYWPGPLTMIFPKKDIVPYGTTGGLDTNYFCIHVLHSRFYYSNVQKTCVSSIRFPIFTLMRRYRCGLPRNDKGAA